MKIFIPVIGQFVNIGDTLHRKILLSWLKREDLKLHVFVGKAPQSFIEALGLRTSDKLYTSYLKWALSMFISSIKEKTGFIYNPGELTMSSKRLLLEIGLLPFHFFIKLRKGFIVRVGIAAKSDIDIRFKTLWNKIFAFSDKIYWRTEKSHIGFKMGQVIPDLAFYDTDAEIDLSSKRKLIISMRGDRVAPTEEWFEIMRSFISRNELEAVVVSQVRIDNERTEEIARKLSVKSYIWEDNVTHNVQEELLNNLYRGSVMSISDRLHVLIAAFTKGVIPVNLTVSFSSKVQDHFDVINLKNVTINPNVLSKEEVIESLNKKLENGFDLGLMKISKLRLEEVRSEISNFI